MSHGTERLRGVGLFQERQRLQCQDSCIRHYVGYVPICSSKACNCTDRCTTLKGLVKARKSRVKMPSPRARTNPDVIRALLAGMLAAEVFLLKMSLAVLRIDSYRASRNVWKLTARKQT